MNLMPKYALFALILLITRLANSPALANHLPRTQSAPVEQCALGMVFFTAGQRTTAKQQLETGFAGLQETDNPDPNIFGQCALFLGHLRFSIGNLDAAVAAYNVALTQFETIGDDQLRWTALFGIGSILMQQMRLEEAQNTLTTAFELARDSRQVWVPADIQFLARVISLNNLAVVGSGLAVQDEACAEDLHCGPFEEVMKQFKSVLTELQSMTVAVTPNDAQDQPGLLSLLQNGTITVPLNQGMQMVVLISIGEAYRSQEMYAEAYESYDQAQLLAERALEDTGIARNISQQFGLITNALALKGEGLALQAEGDLDTALTCLREAETLLRQGNKRLLLALVLADIGDLLQARHEPDESFAAFAEAFDLLAEMRLVTNQQANFVPVDSGAQMTPFLLTDSLTQVVDLYKHVTNLYYEAGRYEEAFYTAERGRARVFLDMMRVKAPEILDDQGNNLLVREQEAYILRQLAEDDLALAQLLDLDGLTKVAMQRELTGAEAAYAEIVKQIQARGESTNMFFTGEDEHVLTVPEIQARLDSETTLVSYFLYTDLNKQDHFYAFVITREAFTTIPLPITRDELENTIFNFRSFRKLDAPPHTEELRRLYDTLISPFVDELNTPYLLIVPHDVLHYVPFTALSDRELFLGEQFIVTILPSASTLASLPAARETTLPPLLLGDPRNQLEFGDEEVEAIAELYATIPFTRSAATEGLVWRQAGQSGILHIAAHGTFDNQAPMESRLFLAPEGDFDGDLHVYEMYGLDLKQTNLVVFTACQLDLEKGVGAGDDVVAMNRALLYAGTPSAITSLWNVDDETTTLLMTSFYAHLQAGLGKAVALQQAQIDLRAQYPQYAHPYYWAGFVFMGDAGKTNTSLPGTPPPISTVTPTEFPTPTLLATAMSTATPTPLPLSTTISTATAPIAAPTGQPKSENSGGGGLCNSVIGPVGLVLLFGLRKIRRRT